MALFEDLFGGESSTATEALGDLGLGSYIPKAFDWFAGDDEAAAQPPAVTPASYSIPMAASMPQLAPLVGGLMGLASRFPALYTAIMGLRARGIRASAEMLYTLMRRWGPGALVGMGILSMQAVSELMMYRATRKRRRMNSLNPRALSRATRRLVAFERRSSKVMSALSGIRGRRSVRRGRCSKCRRSPCAC